MAKPADVFDRESEWASLDRFATTGTPGATLGLVYGRRRQGKTFLLQALTEVRGGLYFAALRQSDAQNLQRLADAYRVHTRSRAPVVFPTWDDALEALLALGDGSDVDVPVVIDEFPYAVDGAPQLPSLLQASLGPRSTAARRWRTRLILCGSALSTMRGLLAGTAPLRGRASLELMIHPFGYREAAAFWGVAAYPELALRLHALVGGTAAYLDMCGGTGPRSAEELHDWVAETLLHPASAMFREGHVLLSEEDRVSDTAVYFAVLSALTQGRTRRGQIAAAVGKAEGAVAHPLTVLIHARLVASLEDALKQKRATYHIAEPILRLHQMVVVPNEPRLQRHQGSAVWAELAGTVASQIYGPHFEHIARTWCTDHASEQTLGGRPSAVGPTRVACREHRVNHEADVVVVQSTPNSGSRVVAIGEAKWRRNACELGHLRRLEHLRALLGLPAGVKLLLFSRGGFDSALSTEATARDDVELIDLARLYHGS